MSTDESESCYLASLITYTKTATLSTKTIINLSSQNLINSITATTFTDSSPKMNPIAITNNEIIDTQCFQKPFQFTAVVQTPTAYNKATSCSEYVSPTFETITKVCDTTSAAPSITYFSDSDYPIEMTLDSTNGKLSVNNAPSG